jgi:hypothetical protein
LRLYETTHSYFMIDSLQAARLSRKRKKLKATISGLRAEHSDKTILAESDAVCFLGEQKRSPLRERTVHANRIPSLPFTSIPDKTFRS